MKRLDEYRPEGTRNFIRVGDVIWVKPSPGKRDGYKARVVAIRGDDDGAVVGVDVVGQRRPGTRTLGPDRIRRLARTRSEAR